jgi:hypothetical protein
LYLKNFVAPDKASLREEDVLNSGLILSLVARELARKLIAFYKIDYLEAKALFRQELTRKLGISAL